MNKQAVLTAGDVFEILEDALHLAWVSGNNGNMRGLEAPDARWSGMALVGYLNTVHANRVQVIGQHELNYLDELDDTHRDSTVQRIFTHTRTALIIVSDGLPVSDMLRDAAEQSDMPLLASSLPAPELIYHLQFYLARTLSPKTLLHGVLLSVMGHGVLVTGESGVGKSELALEMISLGHHFVADDAVMVRRTAPDRLEGYCNPEFRHFLEVRGLGILNIREMFGEPATRLSKEIELIVHLQRMTPERLNSIDRLRSEQKHQDILGIKVPEVQVPVTPGRNTAAMVEAAVRNQILAERGFDAVEEFIQIQAQAIRNGSNT